MDLFRLCKNSPACYTSIMNYWRYIGCRYKAIGWFLITALAFLTILPVHVHLLQVEDHAESSHATAATLATYGHTHLVDMHIYSSDLIPPHHDDTQVLMSTPDGMIKGLYFNISPMLLIGMLMVMVSLALARVIPRQGPNIFLPIERTYYFKPPLRGPPH